MVTVEDEDEEELQLGRGGAMVRAGGNQAIDMQTQMLRTVQMGLNNGTPITFNYNVYNHPIILQSPDDIQKVLENHPAFKKK